MAIYIELAIIVVVVVVGLFLEWKKMNKYAKQ
jgi:uncharacterized protein YneF (UPF0154 family)